MTSTRFLPDTTDAALMRRIAPTGAGLAARPDSRHGARPERLGARRRRRDMRACSPPRAISPIFAQMLLNGGSYNGTRIVTPPTSRGGPRVQDPHSSRALGWDTPSDVSSAGRYFSPRSFGHTGFTGTSHLDRSGARAVRVLLMNRVNPHGIATRHTQLRRDVADAVQSAHARRAADRLGGAARHAPAAVISRRPLSPVRSGVLGAWRSRRSRLAKSRSAVNRAASGTNCCTVEFSAKRSTIAQITGSSVASSAPQSATSHAARVDVGRLELLERRAEARVRDRRRSVQDREADDE